MATIITKLQKWQLNCKNNDQTAKLIPILERY